MQFDFTPTRLQFPPSAQSYLCQLLPLPPPSSSATSMRPASAEPTACKRDGAKPDKSRNRKGSTWVLSLAGGKVIAADHLPSPLAKRA